MPGQQSQLKIKAHKELVQDGTFTYFLGNLAYTNKKFLHTELKSCFPLKTHCQKRFPPHPP